MALMQPGGAWSGLLGRLSCGPLEPWSPALQAAVAARLADGGHGDLPRWEAALARLPDLPPGHVDCDRPCVGVRADQPLDRALEGRLRTGLMALHPWRKGPYCLHGLHLDSEWRSDWKWERLAGQITPLEGRLVLDVGCGNGYHAWRMLGAGARLAFGIDPTWLYAVQFRAIDRYLGPGPIAVLPLALEDLPVGLSGFDTVFSMGVLYHRRSPADHLARLARLLRPGGELVLETLVLPGPGARQLQPPGRYAAMRNCWSLPTLELLCAWVEAQGFRALRAIDVTVTGTTEQRSTDWMRFQSLADSLDPRDASRTIEGHPPPTRAILIAERRG
jgi:tRNA (mo5U34)-methyltransferase